jgi:hypothetical protein
MLNSRLRGTRRWVVLWESLAKKSLFSRQRPGVAAGRTGILSNGFWHCQRAGAVRKLDTAKLFPSRALPACAGVHIFSVMHFCQEIAG